MASGFVQRWKGKVAASEIYIGGVPAYGAATISQSLSILNTTGTITNYGVTAIAATSGLAIVRLAAPQYAGQYKTIELTTVSSGIFITASTDASVTLNGGTMNTIKSTLAGVVTLRARSTTDWAIVGVYPSTTGFPTLSTST